MTKPLFTFEAPDRDAALDEGMRRVCHIPYLNVIEVASWLVRKGVLSLSDRTKPAEEWAWPRRDGEWLANMGDWIKLRERCTTNGDSYAMGRRIIEAVQDAAMALRCDGTSLEEGFAAITRAQDGANAAWAAGYRDYPIPQLCDGLARLMAAIAGMLRDEILERILAGKVPADEATTALAVLREGWTPEVADSAAWFADRQ